MAQSRVRAAGFAVTIHAEGFERTDKAFRDVRTRIARRTRDIVRESAEHTVLPRARHTTDGRSIAGRSIASSLIIARGVRRDSAFLTTNMRGIRGRAVGLLEFGGTVRVPINPRKKKALHFGGRFAARVTTPRIYHARLFLSRARDSALPAFGKEVRDRLAGEFAREGFEVR